MTALDFGDQCPESLFPMFGLQVCMHEFRKHRAVCGLAEGHGSDHAELDPHGRVISTWRVSQ